MADKRPVGSRRRPGTRIREVTVTLASALRTTKSPEARSLLRQARTFINLAKKAEVGA